MCKNPNINVGIKSLDFTEKRGKMVVYFTDGRVMIVPLNMFPDIKKMPVSDRKDWMVLDDQYFTFNKLSKIYSITDLFQLR